MSAKSVSIELDRDVFEALQRLAKPFVDTPSSVIKRLIEHVFRLEEEGARIEAQISKKGFTSSRGATIPFGNLRATYKPRGGNRAFKFEATVTSEGIEFDGEVFDSLSSAGIHAKKLAGAKDSASRTNGWEFWEFYDSETNSWVLVDSFRQRQNINEFTLKDLGLE